jgi:hypothetical protein
LSIGIAASLGLNIPKSIIAPATFSFAVVYACYLCWRDEHNRAQGLAEQLTPRLRVTVDKKSIADAIWNGEECMIFLRVIVSSLTARRIQNAKAYLVSIEKNSRILWHNEELADIFTRRKRRRAMQDNRARRKLSASPAETNWQPKPLP